MSTTSDPSPPDDDSASLLEAFADVALFLASPTGIVLTWNSGAAAVVGRSAAEAVGRPTTATCRCLGGELADLDAAARQGEAGTVVDLIRGDGSVRRVVAAVARLPTGRFAIRLTPACRNEPASDVDPGMLDALPARIAVLDAAGRILAVNRAWNDSPVEPCKTPGCVRNSPCDVGESYLEFCRAVGDAASAEGIEAVLRGERTAFGSGAALPEDGRSEWSALHVGRLPRGGALVVRSDATARTIAERAAGLAVRASLAADLANGGPVQPILQKCCQAIVDVLDTAFARVWTLDAAGGTLELQASAGLYTHLDGGHARIPVGALKIGRIARDRVPLLTNAVRRDPNIPEQEWVAREGLTAFAGHPLAVDGRVLGVLATFSRRPLSSVEFESLGGVADLLAQVVQRKRAEAAAAERDSHYRTAIETTPDGFWMVDDAGRLLEVNDVYVRRSGYSREELLALPLSALEAAETPEEMAAHIQAIRAAGSARFETRHRAKDGEVWPLEVSVAFQPTAGGRFYAFFRDVGERKRAEAVLRESERRFQALAASSPVGVYRTDAAGNCVYVNERWRRIAGLSPEQAASDGWAKALHPDDRLKVTKAWMDSVACERPFRMEYRFLPPDGADVWVLGLAVPERNDQGTTIGWIGTITDVGEQKRSEARLRESEERFRAIFENAAVCIARVGLDGRFLEVNDAWLRFLGYSREEMLARTFAEITFPDDLDADLALVRRLTSGDQSSYALEKRYFRKDGAVVWASLVVSLRRAGDGAPRCFISVAQDVTERKKAEAALRESEERLRLALEATTAVAYVWDVPQDEAWRYYSVDPALPANPDSPETIAAVRDRVHPDDRARFETELAACLAEGSRYHNVYRVVHPDGATHWLESFGVLARAADGSPLRLTGVIRDVTERKRAEETLVQSESRYARAVRGSADGMWEWDIATGADYLSPRWKELLGYREDELPDHLNSFLSHLHPDDYERTNAAIDAHLERRVPYDLEIRLRHKSGEYRWIHTRGQAEWDAQGRPFRMAGFSSDVTERKRSEAALLASEGLFRSFFEAPGAMRGIIDLVEDDFEYVGENAESAAFFCGGGSSVGGRARVRGAPDEVVRLWRERCEESRRSAAAVQFEYSHPTAAGPRWLSATVVRLAGQASTDDRFAYVVTDATPRKEAEANLLLRDRAVRAISEAIVITDARSAGRPVIYVSPSFERMTGYSAEEAIGRNCRYLQGPETDPADVERIRAALRVGLPVKVVIRNYRKNGAPFWNELSISPVRDDQGQLTHFVGVQNDVSARRELEEQFRQAQKMDAVGRLAGGVAHDFNNLLTVINGYCELLLASGPSDDAARDALAAIQEAGERAARLTAQLLAFSRRSIVEPKLVDVGRLAESSVRMISRIIGEDVRISVDVAPRLPLVKIDPAAFEQALMNLAINARDAMPRGGRLTIAVSALPTWEGPPGSDGPTGPCVKVTVADDGEGMTKAVRERIFEPFFTTKSAGRGTGLGLAMVYGVVHQAGGAISVESEVGRGTVFQILLPAAGSSASPLEASETSSRDCGGTETILLAEDEADVRRLARLALEMQGYAVVEAASGAAAVRASAAHRGPIHLLLTDVVMPDGGGRQVAEEVRLARPEIRVLYMSGYTDDAVVRHGIEAAVDAFVQKPFTPLTLVRKVRETLDDARRG